MRNFWVSIENDEYIDELLCKAGLRRQYTNADRMALCRCLNVAGLADITKTIDHHNNLIVCSYGVTDAFRETLMKQGIDPATSKARARTKTLLIGGKEADEDDMNDLDA